MGDPSQDNIGQQIQQTAGFYTPTIYDLLSRFGSLITQPDSLGDVFVPLTDVLPPAPSNCLPFVVGFLPPPAPTQAAGQLSREASVAQNSVNSPPLVLNLQAAGAGGGGGSLHPGPPQGLTGQQIDQTGYDFIRGHEGSGAVANGKSTLLPNGNIGPYGDVEGYQTIGVGHLIRKGEDFSEGLTPDEVNNLLLKDAATAGNTVKQQVHVPLTQNQFNALTSMAFSCGGIPSSVLTPLNQNDYAGATAAWATAATSGKNAVTGQTQVIVGMDGIRAREVNLFNTPDGPTAGQPPAALANAAQPVHSDVQVGGSWNALGGSAQSQQAASLSDSVANTSLNTTALGQNFQQNQAAQANVLTQAIQQMAQTPPLRMLVNPRSFKNSLEKITADGNWGRSGPIIEHWGENLDKIEGSGKIAAFYSLDTSPPGINLNNASSDSPSAGPGLSRMTRNYSTSYQNFLSLYLIYRSNAGIWTYDYINPGSGTNAGPVNLATVGSVYIYYDNILYVGGFDTFSITESDEAPFSLEYSFAFTVRAWFAFDQQLDPLLGWQQPVNATSLPGITPQPGSVPTDGAVSSFGPDGGQPTVAQAGLSSDAAGQALFPGGVAPTKATPVDLGPTFHPKPSS